MRFDGTAKQVGAPRCDVYDVYIEFLHCHANLPPLSGARKSLSGNANPILPPVPPVTWVLPIPPHSCVSAG
jgi:hypothetical protein